MKTTKVIFLDIDGVLNTDESCDYAVENNLPEIWRLMPFKKPLEQLDRIVKATGAKVVISSVWRFGGESSLLWECLFAALGFNIDVIGVTPRDKSRIRGREIQQWIDERNRQSEQSYAKDWNYYPVGKFAILDDDADMEHLMPYLFQCDSKVGITAEIADKVIEYFNS